jgi:uncharacterized repeat protein (TIGR01451 family)
VVGGACGATIQACIDFASPDDMVSIPAGVYSESVVLAKAVSLVGADAATTVVTPPAGRGLTIDAASIGPSVVVEHLTFSGGDVSGGNVCFSGDQTNCGGGILVTGGAQPTLQHLVLANNRAWEGGGLYSETGSSLTLSDLTLEGNTSVLEGGGARFFETTLIVDSHFDQNSSEANVGGALAISAAFAETKTLTISASTFISNTTQGLGAGIDHGGAVYAFDLDVSIVDSQFEGNLCTGDCDGGAVWLSGSFNAPILTLDNTDFIDNAAGRFGGGVWANAPVGVTGGTFQGNQANGVNSFKDGGGGLAAQTVTLNGTQFLDNTAQGSGGGLNADLGAELSNGYFEGNRSLAESGGAFATRGITPVVVTDTTVISNTAQVDGGGLFVEFGSIEVTGGAVSSNAAVTGSGGGIYVDDDLALTTVDLESNSAAAKGGGAYAANGNATLNGSLFLGNTVEDGISFSDGGGGLYVAAGSLGATNTTFDGNLAPRGTLGGFGGGAYAAGTVTLVGGLFQNNQAGNVGGGVYTATGLDLTGTQIVNNTAQTGGGTFADGITTVVDALFQNNDAVGGTGGGLRTSGVITITGSTTPVQFLGNTATLSGGGFSASSGVSIANAVFNGNHSDDDGGAFSTFADPVTVIDSQFVANTANGRGGAINGSLAFVDLTNCHLQGNSSSTDIGGGLYTNAGLTSTDTTFANNTAQLDGGGAYVGSDSTLEGGSFEGNTSTTGSGGGIYELSSVAITGTSFLGNQAGSSGGGAYIDLGASSSLVRGLFSGNSALGGAGGGLYVGRQIDPVSDTRFLGNSAGTHGGGMFFFNSRTGAFTYEMSNVLFGGNSAGGNGAGLYFEALNDSLELKHGTFGAPAPASGEAVFAVDGTVNLTNTIVANHAVGIAQTGTAVVNESYTLFSDNTADTAGTVGDGTGSTSGDPAFVDPASGDYHLTSPSTARDAGIDAGVAVDFEGEARPQGAGHDIGFDEWLLPDLVIVKTADVGSILPGAPITYTLVFSNTGVDLAAGVAITDTVPAEITGVDWSSSGAAVVQTGLDPLSWTVEDLSPGEGGAISLTATVASPLARDLVVTNTAQIVGSGDTYAGNDSDDAPITILNGGPVAHDDNAATDEDTPVDIEVVANDTDVNGDALMVTEASDPPNGNVVPQGTTVQYTPDLDFTGIDAFTYTVSDGLLTDSAVVTVTVNLLPCVWDGSAGSWDDSTKWSCDRVPGLPDTAIIGGGTVTADTEVSVGALQLDGGFLQGSAIVTVQDLDWSGGSMAGAGTTVIPVGGTLHITGVATLSRALDNFGPAIWSGNGDFSLSSGVFNNKPGATFTAVNDRALKNGTFNNEGLFVKTTGTGTTQIRTVFNNSGEIQVASGTLRFTNNSTSTGTLTAAEGTVVEFADAIVGVPTHTWEAGSSLTADTVIVRIVTNILGSYSVSETTVFSSTANFGSADHAFPRLMMEGGTMTGDGVWTVQDLDWAGGAMAGGGTTVIPLDGTLDITGVATLSRVLDNFGPATWSGTGDFSLSGGVFNNKPGATFTAMSDGTLKNGTFNNEGIFIKPTGTGTTQVRTVFNNSGDVQVASGTLRFASHSTSTGTLTAAAGTVVEFADAIVGVPTHTWEVGSILTADTVIVRIVTNILGSYSVPETTVFSSTANFGSADRTLPHLTMEGGTVTGDGVLTVQDLDWAGGAMAGGGTTVIPLDGTLDITGVATLSRALDNFGPAVWSGTGDFSLSSGVFNNKPGATFTVLNDKALKNGMFNNEGLFVKTTGTGLTEMRSVWNNSGEAQIQTGTFRFTNHGSSSGSFTAGPGTVVEFVDGISGQPTQTFSAGSSFIADTAVFVSSNVDFTSSTVATGELHQTGGSLSLGSSTVTVANLLSRAGGGFSAGTSSVVFDGPGIVGLDLAAATAFNNLSVAVGTTLVEQQSADNASVGGALDNQGIIRKTKDITSTGPLSFGLTRVDLGVDDQGSLSQLQVDRVSGSHPSADFRTVTGRYWTLTPTGSGFSVDLTLPHGVAPDTNATICRFGGGEWDCQRDFSTATTVTRFGVTALSDWAIGDLGLPDPSVPHAHAGSDRTIHVDTQTVMLGAEPAASGGTPPYSYAWTITPSTGFTLSSAEDPNPTFTGHVLDVFTAELVVTDSDSVPSDPDSAEITVVCPTQLDLFNLTVDANTIFEALERITAEEVVIQTGIEVIFLAGQEVRLMEGFVVEDDATFTVVVDPTTADCQ